MIVDRASDEMSLSALHKTLVVVRYSSSYYASGGVSEHLHALNTALSSLLHLTVYQLYLDTDKRVRVSVIAPDQQFGQGVVPNDTSIGCGVVRQSPCGDADSGISCMKPSENGWPRNVLGRLLSGWLDKSRFLLDKNLPSLLAQIRCLRTILCRPNYRWLSLYLPGIRAQIRLNDRLAQHIANTIRSVRSSHPDKRVLYIDHCPYQPLTLGRLKAASDAGALTAAVYHGGYEQADIRLLAKIAQGYRLGALTLKKCPLRLYALIASDSKQHGLLHNGVDIAFFDRKRIQPGAFRARIGASASSRLILVPARVTYQKGLHDFLDALAALPFDVVDQLVVVFAGQANSCAYRKWLETKVSRSAALRTLTYHFVGNLDQTALRDGYRDSDLVVLPSRSEGVPRVLIEAQAMGIRCVATDVGGTRDAVVNARCVRLVRPADISQIAQAIRSMLEASVLCDDEVRKNRQSLEARSGLVSLAKRHGEFYRSMSRVS